MKLETYQCNFTKGEISPDLRQRTDVDDYAGAAKTVRNGIPIPQGGVTKRNGFKILQEIKSNVGNFIKQIPLVFSDSEQYLCLLKMDGSFNFYTQDGIFISSQFPKADYGDGDYNENGTTFLRGTDIESAQYGPTLDPNEYMVVHPLFCPITIRRNGTNTFEVHRTRFKQWLADPKPDPLPEDWKPSGKYITIKSPMDKFGMKRYAASPWTIQQLTFDAKNGDEFTLGFMGKTAGITYSVTETPVTDDTQQDALVGDNATGLVNSIRRAITSFGKHYTIEAVYDEQEKVYWRRRNGAVISITVTERKFKHIQITVDDQVDMVSPMRFFCLSKTSYDSNLIVRPIYSVFIDESLNEGTEEGGEYKGELAWSESRGYPATVCAHSGRMVLGGSYGKPLGLWFTQSGLSYHFSPDYLEEPLANDSISLGLSSTTATTISGMVSSRSLLVLTGNSLISVSGGSEEVITPLSVASKLAMPQGSKHIKPVLLDDFIYFINSDTGTLNATAYEYSKDTYVSTVASLWSSHLVQDVEDMAVVNTIADANTSYIVLRNKQGGLSAYTSIKEQSISSWSSFTTEGFVRSVGALSENLYIIVLRGGKQFLEVLNPRTVYADSNTVLESPEALNVLGGLSHFEGKTLAINADGHPFSATVNNGVCELPFLATRIEYGLPIDFKVETLNPAIVLKSNQVTLNDKKRVSKVSINFQNTIGVSIEYSGKQYEIDDRKMGFKFGEAPEPFSETRTKRLLGWCKEATVSVVSNKCAPCTVTSIEKTVNVKGSN